MKLQQESAEWSPYMLSATLYLMTRYALKPCPMLASLAARHLRLLAQLSPGDMAPLGESRLRNLEKVWEDMSRSPSDSVLAPFAQNDRAA